MHAPQRDYIYFIIMYITFRKYHHIESNRGNLNLLFTKNEAHIRITLTTVDGTRAQLERTYQSKHSTKATASASNHLRKLCVSTSQLACARIIPKNLSEKGESRKDVYLDRILVMKMNLLDLLLSTTSIASGVVLGTLLTWIISYYMGKRLLPKLIRSLSENPEIINSIQTLRKNSESVHNK